MARYLYAATPADYVVNASTGLPVPNAVVTVWNARTGGSQVTDLQTLAGGTITQVTADSQGYIAFYGPDNMTDLLWIYAGSGPRLAVRAATDFALKAAPLPLSGGTMTGPLVLSGAPTLNLHAATKQYVDNAAALVVVKTGDTMSGSLRVNQASVKVTGDASTYTFERRQGDGTGYGFRLGATPTLPLTATLYDSGGNTLSAALSYSTSTSQWAFTGNVNINGTLTLAGDPAANLQAATKQYVDAASTRGFCAFRDADYNVSGPVGGGDIWVNVASYETVYGQSTGFSASTGIFTVPNSGTWELVGWILTASNLVAVPSIITPNEVGGSDTYTLPNASASSPTYGYAQTGFKIGSNWAHEIRVVDYLTAGSKLQLRSNVGMSMGVVTCTRSAFMARLVGT